LAGGPIPGAVYLYEPSILQGNSQCHACGADAGEILPATTIIIMYAGSHDNGHVQTRDNPQQSPAPAVPINQIEVPDR
jgi:hypothetical protein